MQTEIDHFLKEQNDLLSQQNGLLIQQINLLTDQNNALNQQVSSLKNILSKYSEVEQSLQNKISNLNAEIETLQALISALKLELSKLEQGNFSEQLQQAFQNNVLMQLQTPLTRALNQLDLNSIVSDLIAEASAAHPTSFNKLDCQLPLAGPAEVVDPYYLSLLAGTKTTELALAQLVTEQKLETTNLQAIGDAAGHHLILTTKPMSRLAVDKFIKAAQAVKISVDAAYKILE